MDADTPTQQEADPCRIIRWAREEAAKNGTEQSAEEGKIVEHYQYKVWQVVEYHKVEVAALQAKAERMRQELSLALAAIELIDSRLADETQHDRFELARYIEQAPQYHNNRQGKTFPFAWGRLRFKQHTTRETAQVVDEEAAKKAFPAFVKTEEKLRWGDLKATLQIAEDGRVCTADGEIVPRELIQGFARATAQQVFMDIDGMTFDLTGGGVHATGTEDADSPDEDGGEADGGDSPDARAALFSDL